MSWSVVQKAILVFCTTLQLILMHQHKKSGCKWLSSSNDMSKQNNKNGHMENQTGKNDSQVNE